MTLQATITRAVKQAVSKIYNANLDTVEFQSTRKEFAGDITVVVFSMLRVIKGNPVEIGTSIGQFLVDEVKDIKAFNVVKGFLNIELEDAFYFEVFNAIKADSNYGIKPVVENNDAVMVEYSSPNTNKPLHLGHVRNNLLGYSVSKIIEASGKKVYKTQIINDRGIHICKSMLAWQRFAPNGSDGQKETPNTTLNPELTKGDKLVGYYYVKFDQAYKKEMATLIASGKTEEEAKKQAPILQEAQQMLQKWEAYDAKVVELWQTMNHWVYAGFNVTYKNLGVDFDSLYYESETYLLGKEFIAEGLKTGVFFKKEDQSVWCDLTSDGLDEKIVIRSDGTAVYMTQDIGTAIQRIKDYPDVGGMVYTVGNEQDYHFQVLFLILKKLGFSWAKNLYHLSYGMVDLPSGKMKSREGTVVDADDLIRDMSATAQTISEDLGKLEGYSASEKETLYNTIGLGALKYYILKVDPKKRILFNPKESIDFQGNTGPFIQYTYARIQSVLRKAKTSHASAFSANAIKNTLELHDKEKAVIKQLQQFPELIQNAAQQLSPALVANYTYDLVKDYNSLFQNLPIVMGNDCNASIQFRVQLSKSVGNTIKIGFKLLGIAVPERM